MSISIGPVYSGPPASRRPTEHDSEKFWVPQGRRTVVDGFDLSGGWIYLGKGLAEVTGYEVEPALIDPSLPTNPNGANFLERGMGYYPSYGQVSPEARASFLKWLAQGRNHPDADIGYVFLYFYGLERRILADATTSAAARAEVPALKAEIERLLTVYGHKGSFRSYAGGLLDYLSASESITFAVDHPSAATEQQGLRFEFKRGLGAMAKNGLPLPAAWALNWYLSDPTVRLKTAAARCRKEFEALFQSEYTRRFGPGIKLSPNKTTLKVVYRTASASFGPGTFTQALELPDVSVLTAPLKKLEEVAQACYAQLDGYSRFLGRNPEQAGTLEALLQLPPPLWPAAVREPLEGLKTRVQEHGAPLVMSFLDLQLHLPESTDLNKSKYSAMGRALGALGIGIEPDARFGGSLPELNESLAVFATEAAIQEETLSNGFAFAALALHLAAAVAHADGDFGEDEEAVLLGQVSQWLHLKPSEQRRLEARIQLHRAAPPSLTGLKKKVDALTKPQKEALGELLVTVVHADGVVAPGEVKALEKVYKLLGLEPGTLYAKLHGGPAIEPITMRPATASQDSFKIPPPPKATGTGKAPLQLDMARVEALKAESARVSVLLGAIFAEQEAAAAPPPEAVEPDPAFVPLLPGLDPDHDGLLQALLTRPEWTRAELEDLCADRNLMVDGAVERINEAAFDSLEEAILEGEDPLEVRRSLLMEKTA